MIFLEYNQRAQLSPILISCISFVLVLRRLLCGGLYPNVSTRTLTLETALRSSGPNGQLDFTTFISPYLCRQSLTCISAWHVFCQPRLLHCLKQRQGVLLLQLLLTRFEYGVDRVIVDPILRILRLSSSANHSASLMCTIQENRMTKNASKPHCNQTIRPSTNLVQPCGGQSVIDRYREPSTML